MNISAAICRPFRAQLVGVAFYTGAYAPAYNMSPFQGSFLRSLWSLSKHPLDVSSHLRGLSVFRLPYVVIGIKTLRDYLSDN